MCAQVNSVNNALVARMSSEDFTAAWHEKRPARRLEGPPWPRHLCYALSCSADAAHQPDFPG